MMRAPSQTSQSSTSSFLADPQFLHHASIATLSGSQPEGANLPPLEQSQKRLEPSLLPAVLECRNRDEQLYDLERLLQYSCLPHLFGTVDPDVTLSLRLLAGRNPSERAKEATEPPEATLPSSAHPSLLPIRVPKIDRLPTSTCLKDDQALANLVYLSNPVLNLPEWRNGLRPENKILREAIPQEPTITPDGFGVFCNLAVELVEGIMEVSSRSRRNFSADVSG